MNTLLEIEPRLAGTEVIEPDEVEFEQATENLLVDCLISKPGVTLHCD